MQREDEVESQCRRYRPREVSVQTLLPTAAF